MATRTDLAANSFVSTAVGDSYRTGSTDLLIRLLLDFTTGTGVGSVTLESSTDGGLNYRSETDAQGNVATWSAAVNTVWPVTRGAFYRWNPSGWTSGTIYGEIRP